MKETDRQRLERAISDDYPNMTGMVIQHSGRPLYKRRFNGCGADHAFHVYSVTKSVFSILIGIAIDQGHIQSVEQGILDFFPHHPVAEEDRVIGQIKLCHLLTMTAPYKIEPEPYEAFFERENWVETALSLLGGEKPLGTFTYSPIVGTHILSGVLAKAVGRPILDFAQENLFDLLDIPVRENVVLGSRQEHIDAMQGRSARGWAVDPQGLSAASWGLFLTTEDLAKLGQLYLHKGLWQGRQIVSQRWVEHSTRVHARWGSMAYGYLWWVIDEGGGSYAALGDGGNALYVNPAKGLVVAITSLMTPQAKAPISLILEQIEPMFDDI